MSIVTIQVIEHVFTDEQRDEMIEKVTEAESKAKPCGT